MGEAGRVRDEINRGRSFECSDVTYGLRPASGRIEGSIIDRVEETVRVPGPCPVMSCSGPTVLFGRSPIG